MGKYVIYEYIWTTDLDYKSLQFWLAEPTNLGSSRAELDFAEPISSRAKSEPGKTVARVEPSRAMARSTPRGGLQTLNL